MGVQYLVDWWREQVVSTGRLTELWLLLGFVVTYAVTRWTTVRIRRRALAGGAPSGPVKDVHIGGVHVHHQVWGILLVLVVGLLEFRFRPGEPWVDVLALLFGVGAALALDEFALWLHLEDVYWTPEGRKSIDAVVIAVVAGVVLLVGTSPVGLDEDTVNTNGWWVVTVSVVLHLVYTIICLLKGKLVVGLVGLPVPLLSLVGAVRLAHPSSFWARRFYGEPKLVRAQDRRTRLDGRREQVRDLLSGSRG